MRSPENRINALSKIFYKTALAASLALLGASLTDRFPSENTNSLPYNIPSNQTVDASLAAIAISAGAFSLRKLNPNS